MKQNIITINTFNDFVEESKKLPDLNRKLNFNLSPLDQHFFDVADKHGVIDQMLDDEYDMDDQF